MSVHAEPKHRFFTWLLVQEKILTADKLQDWNWPCKCNLLCSLCSSALETAQHLSLKGPFAQRVWEFVQAQTRDLVRKPSTDVSIEDWWTGSLQNLSKDQRRTKAPVITYVHCLEFVEGEKQKTFEGKEAESLTMLLLVRRRPIYGLGRAVPIVYLRVCVSW